LKVYLSIGTNLGDRRRNIDVAVAALTDALGCGPTGVSEVVESPAWGFDGPDFLDMVAVWETALSPLEILHICKEIESRMGRRETLELRADGSRVYHDRIIDIDVLTCGDVRMSTPELTLPHPHMHERQFIQDCLATLVWHA